MAERRMTSLSVIDTDKFMEMEPTTQALYFHLNMHADDDGFVGKPKTICRMVGCAASNLDELESNGYIIRFEDGAIVLVHWQVNNAIRKDRYTETQYVNDKALLEITPEGVYVLRTEPCDQLATSEETTCNQLTTSEPMSGNQLTTSEESTRNQRLPQVRLGKDRIVEGRLGKVSIGQDSTGEDRLVQESVGEVSKGENSAQAREAPLDQSALLDLLGDPEMAAAMEKWLAVRQTVDVYPYGAITACIDSAKRSMDKYGVTACLKVINDATEGAWKRIRWEDLENARSGTPYMNAVRDRVKVVDSWA